MTATREIFILAAVIVGGDVAMLELLVPLEYKRQALARRVLGMSGVSGRSYFIVTWLLFMMYYFWTMPLLYASLFGGSFIVIGVTALLVVIVCAAILMIVTVLLSPLGILIL